MKVAILGASGFVGSRLFERWQTRGPHQPRAIVRAPASLARVARFAADWRIADARDERALVAAFAGCDAVVHCVVGDERIIAATIEPAYRAAAATGVRHLIYLSSASVHGQNPVPGTNEDTPLRDDQPFAYNNAKVRAERRLRALASDGRVRVTVLRPGIVWGPRSRWVTDPIEALLAGRGSWIGGGHGICNLCHVDNLVHAIECALAARADSGDTYLVGDAETVTWREFYLGLAALFGRDERVFVEAPPATAASPRAWRDRLASLKSTAPAQAALTWFSPRLKETVKAALARWQRPPQPDPWALPAAPGMEPASLEMSLLFACRTKLPHERATRELGYVPPVNFAAGVRRTAAWLQDAGYPLVRKVEAAR